jgi:Secretion system C-terminal sorting domain
MKTMRLTLFLLLAVLSQAVFAQTFTLTVPDTVKTDTLNSQIVFDVVITNITTSPLSVYLVRKSNILPENWTSSLCFSSCFAPFLDSAATTSDFNSSPLIAGEQRSISLHVIPVVNQGTAYVKLVIGNLNNPSDNKTINFTASTSVTSINDITAPGGYYLAQNYPNPFNPSTVINYSVAKAGQVTLKLYNIIGKEVASLVNEYKIPGNYYYDLNGKNLSSGVYLYKITSGNFVSVKKMVLLK